MQAIVRMEEHVLSTTTIPVTKHASVPQDIQVCPSKSISATCIDQILIAFSMHIHIESWESTNVDDWLNGLSLENWKKILLLPTGEQCGVKMSSPCADHCKNKGKETQLYIYMNVFIVTTSV